MLAIANFFSFVKFERRRPTPQGSKLARFEKKTEKERERERKERSKRKIEERREKRWMTVQKNPIDPRSPLAGVGGSARGKPPRSPVQIRSGGGSNPGWGLLKATGCRPTVGIRVVEGKSRLTVTRYPLPWRLVTPTLKVAAPPPGIPSGGTLRRDDRRRSSFVRSVSRALTPVPSGRSSVRRRTERKRDRERERKRLSQ